MRIGEARATCLSPFTSPGTGLLISAMSKPGARLITPLLALACAAASAQGVLPEPGPPPEVDTITPVPPPEIPFGGPDAITPQMPRNLKIDNIGGGPISGSVEEGVRFEGPGVKITGDNGLEVFANSAALDIKAETVTLQGDVSVYQGNMLQRGDKAVYFYERKFLDTSGLRASVDPILLESGKFTVQDIGGKQVFIGHDAAVTTHDVENPNFWVRARETRIYPGEKVVFDDLRLYAGGVPVFWLPYLSQPLDADLGYHFIPGARSNWGPYLLNSYGIMLGGETDPVTGENKDAWLLSRWRFDIRTTRGIGAGVDFVDTRVENTNELSGLGFYYLNDLDPDKERSGVPRGFVNEDRYKIELKHRYRPKFPGDADWRIDSNLSLLSDQHYLEDLEPSRYRTDPQPDNTLGIYRRDDHSLLSLHTRMRINDFYRADTRLPEIAFDTARSPIPGLPLQHEGTTSFGIIGEQAADPTRNAIIDPLRGMSLGDPGTRRLLNQLTGYERRLAARMVRLPPGDPKREELYTQLVDSGYSRFNTYQEFSLPHTFGGFLSIAPQAGFGYANYGSVDGPGDNFGRTHVHVGTEAAVKLSRDFGAVRDRRFGLDGLLHVVQPYTAWSYISTDDYELGDPGVDRLTPTTRPRPLDPARFTATDEMQNWNVLRFGARNRLITGRDNQSFEWLFLDTYLDAFIDDPEGTRNFSNLYNDIRWMPLPWLGVNLETQFPIADGGSGFSEFNSRFHFLPTDFFEFSVGYRFLDGHPTLVDSNRVDLQTYTRLAENWGVGTRHALEMDDGTLEIQQYTIHRDLGNWVAGVGLHMRDNRREEEYGVVFSLTLKDFPSVSLPFEIGSE